MPRFRANLRLHWLAAMASVFLGTLHAQINLLQLPANSFHLVSKNWNSSNGLPQNTATAILQARDGHLWIATYGGLCRFDGENMEVFDTVSSDGLHSNRINCLFETTDGTLWIGTDSGGISSFRNGRFEHLADLPNSFIRTIGADREGRLLASTAEGLWRMEDSHLRPLFHNLIPEPGRILLRRTGEVLVAATTGIWRLDADAPHLLVEGKGGCLAERDSTVFVGNKDGLSTLEDGELRPWTSSPPITSHVLCLLVASDRALWVGTTARAIRIDATLLDQPKAAAIISPTGSPLTEVQPTQATQSLCEDREGGIWIGHSERGATRTTIAEVLSHRSESGLPPSGLVAVIGDGHGELFASSRYGLLHSRNGHFESVPGSEELAPVHGLCLDPDGTLWAGTRSGLAKLDQEELRIWIPPDQWPTTSVRAIVREPNGDHWLGSDKGVALACGKTITVPPLVDPLRGQLIRSMVMAPDGALWIGGARVLCRIDPERQTMRSWHCGKDIPFGEVRAILPENGVHAWVGSYGGGLVRIDEDNCRVVDERSGLCDQSVCALLVQDEHFVLITNSGIGLIHRAEVQAVIDGDATTIGCYPLGVEGPTTAECSGGVQPCAKAANGRIWVCGIESLLEFDPTGLQVKPSALPIKLENMFVGENRWTGSGSVDAPSGIRSFSIRLGTCSFGHHAQTRYRWRLLGQSDQWSEPSYEREVHLANVPPGNLAFEAEAIDVTDTNSTHPLRITLNVPQLITETRGFWFGLTAGAILGIGILMNLVQRGAARRAIQLQTIVDERTEELTRAQEGLEHRVAERTQELQNAMTQQAADMAERQRLERQLQQLQRMESIGHLAGGIAHDFNNILTVAFGAGQLLETEVTTEDGLELCRNLTLACERGRGLTQHLLAVASRQFVTATRIDLNRVVADLLPVLRSLLGEDVALRFHPAKNPAMVLGAVTQLEQVLLNLSGNAHDAMPRGGEMNIRIDQTETTVTMEVSDTGTGMPPEVADRVFEPFFSTKGREHGRGLGLATVYGITKQLGGEISVQSAAGKGTTLRLTLPMAPHDTSSPNVELPRAAPQRLRGTILLIEDERDVRTVLAKILTNLGCRVYAVEHGAAAVEKLRSAPWLIDAVVSDVVMPGLRGTDLVAALQSIRPGLPIMFLSGYLDGRMTHKDLTEMGLDILEKPVDTNRLAAVLSRLLGSQQLTPSPAPPAAPPASPTAATTPSGDSRSSAAGD
jgi:two-component system, cell cycle sensor histidine kinase and response regulator CckA